MDALLTGAAGNAAAATVLALAVAAVAPWVRSPALRHRLWLLVPLKLLLPPVIAVPLAWPSPERATGFTPVVPVQDHGGEPRGSPEKSEPRGSPPWAAAAEPALGLAGACTPPAPFPWPTFVASIWLTGSLAWWGLAAVRVRRFRRALRLACPAPVEWQARADALAARLGLRRLPRVWVVPAAVPPLVWALTGRPCVLLPTALWGQLSDAQRDGLLLHELAHLRRGDHWVRRLELLVLGLYWWLPTAWWARREVQRAEEECCDAWVVWAAPQAAGDYALALVETMQFLATGPEALPAVSAAGGPDLKARVTMILKQTPARPGSWRTAAAVAVTAGLCLPWGAALTQPAPAPAPSPAGPVDVGTDAGLSVQDPNQPGEVNVLVPDQPETAATTTLDRQIAAARDEIELLQVQVGIRQAHMEVARAKLAAAESRLKRVEQLFAANTGSATELDQARYELALARANLTVSEAELREPLVKQGQARRRLTELEKAKKDTPTPEELALRDTVRRLEKELADTAALAVGPDHPSLAMLRKRLQDARERLAREQSAKRGDTAAGTGPAAPAPVAARARRLDSKMDERTHVVRYALTNSGTQPLRVASVRTGSPFLTVQVSNPVASPGQQVEFTFVIDRTRFNGSNTAVAYFTFDPPLPGGDFKVDAATSGVGSAKSSADEARVRELEKQIADLKRQLEEMRKRRPDGSPQQ